MGKTYKSSKYYDDYDITIDYDYYNTYTDMNKTRKMIQYESRRNRKNRVNSKINPDILEDQS